VLLLMKSSDVSLFPSHATGFLVWSYTSLGHFSLSQTHIGSGAAVHPDSFADSCAI